MTIAQEIKREAEFFEKMHGGKPTVLYIGSNKREALLEELRGTIRFASIQNTLSAGRHSTEYCGMKLLTVLEEPDHLHLR